MSQPIRIHTSHVESVTPHYQHAPRTNPVCLIFSLTPVSTTTLPLSSLSSLNGYWRSWRRLQMLPNHLETSPVTPLPFPRYTTITGLTGWIQSRLSDIPAVTVSCFVFNAKNIFNYKDLHLFLLNAHVNSCICTGFFNCLNYSFCLNFIWNDDFHSINFVITSEHDLIATERSEFTLIIYFYLYLQLL